MCSRCDYCNVLIHELITMQIKLELFRKISENNRHLQVEEMNSLVSELVKVTTTERLALEQCKDFLSTLSAMQVSLAMDLLLLLLCFFSLFELAFVRSVIYVLPYSLQQVKDCSLRTHIIQLKRLPLPAA